MFSERHLQPGFRTLGLPFPARRDLKALGLKSLERNGFDGRNRRARRRAPRV
jgi:hypothetical protein